MPRLSQSINLTRLPGWLSILLLSTMLVLASGCTMAPSYERPEAPTPDEYSYVSGEGETPPAGPDFFEDPVMGQIIKLALENNRDLRISMLNIEKVRAQYQIQRADLFPGIGASGSHTSQRLPADFSSSGNKGMNRQYSASLGFSSYELDLFGGVRSLTESAYQQYFSAEESANSARISLVAETAAMYLQLVANREQYDLTLATVANRQHSYDLILRKFEAGVASDLELSQARSVLDESRASLASAATRVGQDENALSLLMGVPLPADLPEVRRLAEVTPFKDVPAGLPSNLMERRPDILAAEHQLMSANADIGAARANFFPSISLTGSLGKLSTDYSGLFDGATRTWSFMPSIYLPIFSGGRNVAQLEMAGAQRDIAVATYEKSIQTAFREVADTLVQREHISDQLDAQHSLAEATGKSYSHASARYDAGVAGYINVLDAQRSLLSAQSALISTRLLRETNALNLYKALGGGWE